MRHSRARAATLIALVLSVSGCVGRRPTLQPTAPRDITSLTLVGQYRIAPLGLYPPGIGVPFGGISGITLDRDGMLWGISDAQLGGRIYRLAIEGAGTPSFRVTPVSWAGLEGVPRRDRADDESLARPNSTTSRDWRSARACRMDARR